MVIEHHSWAGDEPFRLTIRALPAATVTSSTVHRKRWAVTGGGMGCPATLEGVLGGHRGTGAPQMGVGEADRLSGKLVREDIAG